MSKRIAIDFSATSSTLANRFTLLGAGLLLLGLASILYVAQRYTQAQANYLAAQQRLSEVTPASQVHAQASPVDQVAAANRVAEADMVEMTKLVAELNTPWPALFAAIERVSMPDLTLLSIAPNKKTRQVTLTGQANNLATVLHYVAQLQTQSRLLDVYLQKHQVELADAFKPVSFTIIGRWP